MTLTSKTIIPLIPYRYGPSHWQTFQAGISREWILTNGIGGYASSTLTGANTRRQHGLLIASLPAPLDRQVTLAKVEEEIGQDDSFYPLSTNQYRDSVFPEGFRYLAGYSQDFFPTWIFRVPGITLKKWLFLKQGENTVVLGYTLLDSPAPVRLYVRCLVTHRSHHHLVRSDSKRFLQESSTRSAVLKAGGNGPFLYLIADAGSYHPSGQWYYNFRYHREKERGLDFEEDLFCPGSFAFTLAPGDTVYCAASTSPFPNFEPRAWQADEEERLTRAIVAIPGASEEVHRLQLAADAFVVQKHPATVIAGYPWLNDWGRDALISVPGLFLVNGRFEEAKKLLETYASRLKNGLLPNSFYELELNELKEINRQVQQEFHKSEVSNPGDFLSYHSVDAPLWLFYAVYKTFQYTRDSDFVRRMLPALGAIVRAYIQGTYFSIRAGTGGLLVAGEPETHLTWMDASVGHLVVTPRNGAPVEVNALWYNALKIMETFSSGKEKWFYADQADQVLSQFQSKFWNPRDEMLYDCLGPNGPDASLRPNQIFALSLPFRALTLEQEKKVFQNVSTHLFTPFGLRTLAPSDPNYKGSYQGDRWLRDRALHQGTAWPWLLGPYMTALVNVEGDRARGKVLELLSPILAHLEDAGIGTISEIFWGNFPHEPAGCIAKAWSVAEVLRAYVEEGLGIKP